MHNHALGGRIIQLNVLRRNLFRKKSAGCALYDGQRPMMETIVCHPGCTQQELASMLCITPASVALSTKRLQKAGFSKSVETQTTSAATGCMPPKLQRRSYRNSAAHSTRWTPSPLPGCRSRIVKRSGGCSTT